MCLKLRRAVAAVPDGESGGDLRQSCPTDPAADAEHVDQVVLRVVEDLVMAILFTWGVRRVYR